MAAVEEGSGTGGGVPPPPPPPPASSGIATSGKAKPANEASGNPPNAPPPTGGTPATSQVVVPPISQQSSNAGAWATKLEERLEGAAGSAADALATTEPVTALARTPEDDDGGKLGVTAFNDGAKEFTEPPPVEDRAQPPAAADGAGGCNPETLGWRSESSVAATLLREAP